MNQSVDFETGCRVGPSEKAYNAEIRDGLIGTCRLIRKRDGVSCSSRNRFCPLVVFA